MNLVNLPVRGVLRPGAPDDLGRVFVTQYLLEAVLALNSTFGATLPFTGRVSSRGHRDSGR